MILQITQRNDRACRRMNTIKNNNQLMNNNHDCFITLENKPRRAHDYH